MASDTAQYLVDTFGRACRVQFNENMTTQELLLQYITNLEAHALVAHENNRKLELAARRLENVIKLSERQFTSVECVQVRDLKELLKFYHKSIKT